MNCEVLSEAIDAIAGGIGSMNAFVSRHGGDSNRMMPMVGSAPEQIGDAARMLGRERDLMREVARLAQRESRR